MTQKQAVVAYGTLMRMGSKVSGKDAFALFRLKKKLKDVVEFQTEEEQKLVAKYNGTVTDTGRIVIPENRDAFVKEHEELGNMECDIEPVEIGMIDATMDEIEALDGFVTWRE